MLLLFASVWTPAYADSLSFTPSTFVVCAGGSKTFTITHAGGGQNQFQETASSLNSSIATVSPASPAFQTTSGNPKVTPPYTVTGISAGTTTIHGSDTGANPTTADLSVNVNSLSTVTPASLTFTGTTATQTLTVTDLGPQVQINATSSDVTVATVTASALTNSGTQKATLTVTPVSGSKNGSTSASATITITDAAGCPAKTVNVTITPGDLTLNPTSLTLAGGGASKTFTASESLYTGLFSASSANTQVATVSPASGNGPGPTTFTVSPVGTAFGPTAVTVTDDHGGSQQVSVVVTGGTITAGSNSVTFTAGNNTNAHLAAAASIAVTGSLQTTSSGTGQITVSSPASVGGAHSTLPIAYLTYNCTATGTGTNQGGSFASGFLQLIASASATPCVTFPASQFSSLSFNMNLFLDVRALPADSYSGGGFQIVLSAT